MDELSVKYVKVVLKAFGPNLKKLSLARIKIFPSQAQEADNHVLFGSLESSLGSEIRDADRHRTSLLPHRNQGNYFFLIFRFVFSKATSFLFIGQQHFELGRRSRDVAVGGVTTHRAIHRGLTLPMVSEIVPRLVKLKEIWLPPSIIEPENRKNDWASRTETLVLEESKMQWLCDTLKEFGSKLEPIRLRFVCYFGDVECPILNGEVDDEPSDDDNNWEDMDDSDEEEDDDPSDDENPFEFDSDGTDANFLEFLSRKFPGNPFSG